MCKRQGYGSDCSEFIEILQLRYIDQVIDVGFAGRAVPRCCRGGDSRAPTIAAAQVPQLQYFFVVDVPVVQVHLGVQLWTRLLTCPSLCNDRVFHSGSASDTVHRLFMWTFQLCNTDGYDVSRWAS